MEGQSMEKAMAQAHIKLGIEDYLLFPEDGRRHELIDGEHIVTAAPTSRHQLLVMQLGSPLFAFANLHRLGRVLPAPTDVVLSPHDIVQPDLLFVSATRIGIVRARIEGPPELAVEVLSPSSRRTDEMLKRRAYERWGVLELWVVDDDVQRVRVYRRGGDGAFGRAQELSAEHGDALATPLLPGFEMRLVELFTDPLLSTEG
jgi:Uma2 family endonuclease